MIAAHLLTPACLVLGWSIALAALLWAIRHAPWLEVLSDARRQHLFAAAALCVVLLWLLRRDFASGLSYHLLGMTVVALLLGWPLASLAGGVAQLALLLMGRAHWAVAGIDFLLQVVLPVLIAAVCAVGVERRQPRNLFVYIFFCGFFPAALAVLALVVAITALLWLGESPVLGAWEPDTLGYLWLLLFPEALLNGMLLAALVVFCPQWVDRFNAARYLASPGAED